MKDPTLAFAIGVTIGLVVMVYARLGNILEELRRIRKQGDRR